MEEYEYETKRIDHLGIVAGICKRINLIEMIDGQLPSPVERKVSCGEATQAMVLNALGLSGRALYLMPEYMKNKPVELLIREGLKAEDFNDDTLGRALDELQQAGVTGMFASIAGAAVKEYKIERAYAHVDSSSITLGGKYDSEYAERIRKTFETAKVTQGYSKDKRPELKQIVVNLITSQASALPLWLEVLDGNSSDKTTFQKTVEAYCKQLEEGEEEPWFIMDSAGYSVENLQAWGKTQWIMRVPETSTLAKETIKAVATQGMRVVDDNYRIYPLCTWYADIKQRWLLVYSKKAYKQEEKQFRHRIAKKQNLHEKQWRKLCREQFDSTEAATAALQTFSEQLAWWQVSAQVNPVKKYKRPGRPRKGDEGEIVGWRIQGQIAVDEEAVVNHTQWLGRFILASNILDEDILSDKLLLARYKEQASSVERGFRFLKDPMFFADSLFLQSPARIMAMTMIMGLALLVYSLAERELRLALREHDLTIPHQTGRPTQNVTMRRVAQLFEGVDLLLIKSGQRVIQRLILNLSPLRLKILKLFHPFVHNCYLLDFTCGT